MGLVWGLPRYGQVRPFTIPVYVADTGSSGNANGIQNTDGSVNAIGELYLKL